MKNMKENVKRKSVKKIVIKYGDNVQKLDPKIASLAVFGLSASLIISGYALHAGVDYVQEKHDDFVTVREYYEDTDLDNIVSKYTHHNINSGKTWYDYVGLVSFAKKYDDPNLEPRDCELVAIYKIVRGLEKSKIQYAHDFAKHYGDYETVEDLISTFGFESMNDVENYVEEVILNSRGR